MNTITLLDMLRAMETGQAFRLSTISYDRKRKTGGKVLHYPEAQLYQPGKAKRTGRALTKIEQQRQQLSRRPNHGTWFTRNIQLVQDGYPVDIIKKIHPPLVVAFNGKTLVG